MHDDRELAERRIDRELWERVLPLVHADRVPLTIEAGPSLDALEPFEPGTPWGAAWQTTWFRLTGEVPTSWAQRAGSRVEATIDLGFTRSPAGFQAEGMIVQQRPDGTCLPVQGIHPDRQNVVLDQVDGSIELLIEAASNPTFPQFAPSNEGLVETASPEPIYRFRTADLLLVDVEADALVHDLDVLDGRMRAMSTSDPNRAKLRAAIVAALDAVPDIDAARSAVAAHLEPVGGAARRHRVIATGHAHIDTAWLWPIRETIRKCTRTFSSAVGLMDVDPAYKFTCSQAQQYAWIEERHPELFAKIGAAVERGQWLPVGGMWVEADMNLPSGESLARQIVHGQRYFTEKFGAPSREVWIPDVFGYPAGLPQLFAAGGMERFVTQKLSWNKQNRFPHHTFWWEGLDGTQVLTHFPPVDTYNATITAGELATSLENFKDHAWSDVSLMPFGHGDGGGGPTREMLERAHRLADIDANATLEVGSPDDFFTAVEREVTWGADVPVWRGELYFEMHRGTLTSQLDTKLGNRRCERALFAAELWEATAGGPVVDDAAMSLDAAWKQVLTQQFHDILPGSSIAWVHRDAEEAFGEVEAAVSARTTATQAALVVGPVSVFNAADVPFSGVAVCPASAIEAAGLADAAHQVVGDGVALGVEAAALSVSALEPREVHDRVVLTDCSMTNGHLSVRWNKHGDITSIIDIAAQRELVPEGERAAALELAVDQPVEYDAWDLESWTRAQGRHVGNGNVTIDAEGPLVGRVTVVRKFGPSTVTAVYELCAESRQLDVDLHIDWHHDEHLLSMVFPLDVRADTAACDVQFGVTHRPTHPSSPWDAAKFEVCAHRYVSVSEPSFGAAVLNDGRYGHAVFDGAIRVSLARAAQYPDPNADRGEHRVRLAVRPHDGNLADVRAAAELFNRPLDVVVNADAAVALDVGGRTAPVIEIVGADGGPALGVEVDAVKIADDGSGHLIVRLHEAVGDRTRISLRCRTRIGAAWRCDLMEEPQRGEEVGDGVVATTLRPFEIVTLRLHQVNDWDGRTPV